MYLQGISLLLSVLFLCLIVVVYLLINQAHRSHPQASESLPPERLSNLTLFLDGRQFFDNLEAEISKATHHIHLSFYIFRQDQLGKTILYYLQKKAEEGVQVRLLLDALGSRSFPEKLRLDLMSKGVQIYFSNQPTFKSPLQSINHRNHRKISVIDGRVGFYGGYNVGNEYIGMDRQMGKWRDYHVRVEGESVWDLQSCFIKDWEKASQKKITHNKAFFPSLVPGKSPVKLVPTPNASTLEDLFISHLEKAKSQVFIGSPYFNPSERLMQTLLSLLERGVSLTILLPAKKDHPFVKPMSFHFFRPLLKSGAKIFHYYVGFYHAKIFIIDGTSCYLGTANFDWRSLFLNDELCSFIYDKTFIKELETKTKKDLLFSTELTLEELDRRHWFEKGKTALTHPLAPLL